MQLSFTCTPSIEHSLLLLLLPLLNIPQTVNSNRICGRRAAMTCGQFKGSLRRHQIPLNHLASRKSPVVNILATCVVFATLPEGVQVNAAYKSSPIGRCVITLSYAGHFHRFNVAPFDAEVYPVNDFLVHFILRLRSSTRRG